MQDIIKLVMAEAAKSNIDKRKVGCVIISAKGDVLGKGYNDQSLHAEEMAVIDSGYSNALEHATAYVSHTPCKNCAETLLAVGITKIEVIEEFMKFDSDKLRYDLIPPKSLEELTRVLTFGASKYKPNNWRKCSDLSRYEGAAMRHIQKWRMGEKHDPETGLNHLAHAMCNLIFIMELSDE